MSWQNLQTLMRQSSNSVFGTMTKDRYLRERREREREADFSAESQQGCCCCCWCSTLPHTKTHSLASSLILPSLSSHIHTYTPCTSHGVCLTCASPHLYCHTSGLFRVFHASLSVFLAVCVFLFASSLFRSSPSFSSPFSFTPSLWSLIKNKIGQEREIRVHELVCYRVDNAAANLLLHLLCFALWPWDGALLKPSSPSRVSQTLHTHTCTNAHTRPSK